MTEKEMTRIRHRNRRAMLKKQGICIECGKNEADKPKVTCKPCLQRKRRWSKLRQQQIGEQHKLALAHDAKIIKYINTGPTTAHPKTERKILVMIARARHRLPLFHPDDAL